MILIKLERSIFYHFFIFYYLKWIINLFGTIKIDILYTYLYSTILAQRLENTLRLISNNAYFYK